MSEPVTEDIGRYYLVLVIDMGPEGELSYAALSRRTDFVDGEFTGPWRALTETEAEELAEAWNTDPERDSGSRARVIEVWRSDSDPLWVEG